jgi:hypothetical protein
LPSLEDADCRYSLFDCIASPCFVQWFIFPFLLLPVVSMSYPDTEDAAAQLLRAIQHLENQWERPMFENYFAEANKAVVRVSLACFPPSS